MIALKNRVHMFTHPKNKERLIGFFTTVLGCTVINAPNSVAFQFVDGSATSVDFTEDVVDALDEQQAHRGAWLEFETDEPSTLKEKILAAGYHQFAYTEGFFYFQIPGGQVMRIKLP
jgi:hypothetical protein